ncbi:MAG TPA: AMP-binding protein, partial [Syntrophales bacterium]
MDDLKTLLAAQGGEIGDKVFVYFRERAITYREMNLLANRYARTFQSLGVRKGDHVAVMLPNCPEWIACWFGLAKLGAVLVAFNTQWKAEGLEYALKQADIQCCLAGPEFQGELKKAGKPPGMVQVIFDRGGAPVEIDGARAFSAVSSGASREEPETEPPRGWDPLIITYTSGTTGLPKAVLNPHRAYLAAAEDLRDYVELGSQDIIYSPLPLYHANPQAYCVLTALVTGASLALAER